MIHIIGDTALGQEMIGDEFKWMSMTEAVPLPWLRIVKVKSENEEFIKEQLLKEDLDKKVGAKKENDAEKPETKLF